MLKNNNFASITCLKSTHLCFLNSTHRYLSHNVQSEITVTRKDDEPVKGLFKNYGFSDTQILKLIKKYPSILSLNIGIAKPKLDYFRSYGFTSNDICHILEVDRCILRCNLENRIIPSFEFLKSLLQDNASVIVAVKRNSRVLMKDISKNVSPNIELLLNHRVPENRILVMLRDQLSNLTTHTEKFKAVIEEIKEFGFVPEKKSFLNAILLFTRLSKSTRERKWDLYRKWGWSEDEILSALRKQPFIMTTSEEKIERVMDFLVNKMGWGVSQVSYHPKAIMHSLENWTMPRCLVVKFLLSKGVLKKNLTLGSLLGLNEEIFRKRFVDQFCVNFPEVIVLYGGVEENAQKFSRKITN
ncbi:hypothetical protein POM88_022448 [Heracleum sosnowskyi]|uniref:Uncharacterized protein n=1 Tax=Heracleum sosnowskyi TaxID=360622 RepID=A0AAD8IGF8_9APIA|nr:hypothetical protein POM88_022448 [Heracleum sosnowskyi]